MGDSHNGFRMALTGAHAQKFQLCVQSLVRPQRALSGPGFQSQHVVDTGLDLAPSKRIAQVWARSLSLLLKVWKVSTCCHGMSLTMSMCQTFPLVITCLDSGTIVNKRHKCGNNVVISAL